MSQGSLGRRGRGRGILGRNQASDGARKIDIALVRVYCYLQVMCLSSTTYLDGVGTCEVYNFECIDKSSVSHEYVSSLFICYL